MGILTRFKDIMASNFHSNKDHSEKDLRKYLERAKLDLGQVHAEKDALIAENERAQRAFDENDAQYSKFVRYAQKAREAGNIDDATLYTSKAESLKTEHDRLAANLERTKIDRENISAMDDKLKDDIATLEGKLKELKNAQSRTGVADSIQAASDTAERLNDLADSKIELSNQHSELDDLKDKYDISEKTEQLTSDMQTPGNGDYYNTED